MAPAKSSRPSKPDGKHSIRNPDSAKDVEPEAEALRKKDDHDRERLREALARLRPAARRLILQRVIDEDLADDILQDTYERAHQSLKSFDASRRLFPWLAAIAMNRATDELRRRERVIPAGLLESLPESDPRHRESRTEMDARDTLLATAFEDLDRTQAWERFEFHEGDPLSPRDLVQERPLSAQEYVACQALIGNEEAWGRTFAWLQDLQHKHGAPKLEQQLRKKLAVVDPKMEREASQLRALLRDTVIHDQFETLVRTNLGRRLTQLRTAGFDTVLFGNYFDSVAFLPERETLVAGATIEHAPPPPGNEPNAVQHASNIPLSAEAQLRIAQRVSEIIASLPVERASQVESRRDLLEQIALLTTQMNAIKEEVDMRVRRARDFGATWRDIAHVAGVSIQAAHKRWGEPNTPTNPDENLAN